VRAICTASIERRLSDAKDGCGVFDGIGQRPLDGDLPARIAANGSNYRESSEGI
jgi:hypothetical protein